MTWTTLISHDLPEQVGSGPQVLSALQIAVAVVTPVEIWYPVTQV